MSETLFKVKRVASGWSQLVGFGMSLPFYPNARRVRKLMVTSEILGSRLPTVRLESLIGDRIADTDAVTLKPVTAHPHNCSIFELTVLATLARAMRPKRVLEIGTYDGRSALAIAANQPADGELITLNLPPDYLANKATTAAADEKLSGKVESGFRWRGHAESARIQQVFGNSLEYAFAQWAPVQMAFIDGGHSHSIVTSDSQNVFAVMDKNDGTVLWHDATRYGVKPALEELHAQGNKIYLIAGTTIAIMRYENGSQIELPY